MPGADKLR